MDRVSKAERELVRKIQKQTNADRIRAMTDEELAQIISSDLCAIVCEDTPVCGGQCESRVLDWLRQEANE